MTQGQGRPEVSGAGLADVPLPRDTVGLLEGLGSTRAVRRYRDEPVPDEVLRAILFGASRAPSGSNRQPFRFLVLQHGPVADEAKRLVAQGARAVWGHKRGHDGYDRGTGERQSSNKSRITRTMQAYVDDFAKVPVLILPCLVRYRAPNPMEGASIYPACQNILLAARALGYGGVLTGFQKSVEPELRRLLHIPDAAFIAATITLGRPVGGHGAVRRRPLGETVYEGVWGDTPAWAVDPPGTRYVTGGAPPPDPNDGPDGLPRGRSSSS
jgi:nitroreductase